MLTKFKSDEIGFAIFEQWSRHCVSDGFYFIVNIARGTSLNGYNGGQQAPLFLQDFFELAVAYNFTSPGRRTACSKYLPLRE